MAKTPKKQSAPKSATKKPRATTKPKAPATPRKEKFDTEAFVFETPIEEIEKALERLEAQEADDMAEPLTKDQIYWWSWYELNLPEAKRRGLTTILTCAKENAVLGLYEKKSIRNRSK